MSRGVSIPVDVVFGVTRTLRLVKAIDKILAGKRLSLVEKIELINTRDELKNGLKEIGRENG